MSLTELTVRDQRKLKQLCIKRLRRFLAPSLQPCIIRINPDKNIN
jgi:hypothetical protein